MTFEERLTWLLLGVVIGFFIGYVTRVLRETKEEVHEVRSMLKDEPSRKRGEDGAKSTPEGTAFERLKGWALLFVVLLTAFGSWKSQAASNDARDAIDKADANQVQLEHAIECIVATQTEFLNAINTRTTYTQSQASANKRLQEAQKVFFGVLLHIPPYTQEIKNEAALEYQKALDEFLRAATASEKDSKITKYPEAEDLLKCIEETKE